ncbi:MAG TPA: aldo/keto reductase [Ilumatobacter sp.]|nr:aldo/keto reductase [Ilumatobacter sp.]
MKYTTLGRSGLKVSGVALGCLSFGDPSRGAYPWTMNDDAADPLFRRAVELGINLWDTANSYGAGTSEEVVGRALKRYVRRDDIVLATKVFHKMHDGPGGSGLSRKAIFEQVDASLTRLGTDYIDLYQIHRPDPETPIEETLEALHDLVKMGKVRYLGVSTMTAWLFSKMQYVASANGWTRFVAMQNHYSLVQREEEREMFDLLADQGVGSIPWSPVARGWLARPWGERSTRVEADTKSFIDSDKPIVDAVEEVAKARGVPMAQIALAWVMKNPVVTAPIIGPTKPDHLSDAAAALEIELTADEIETLERHYTPHAPTTRPSW